MSKTKRNPQQDRIFKAPHNLNIAVSAGAGTGKSTTLKDKVISLINDGVFAPSDFLIVTFTNDAANSLKNKIKIGIRENGGSDELIAEVDSMHIDTLDAFRLFIVKKYAKELGLTGNIGVLDADIMLLEEYKTLEKILEPYYRDCNPMMQEIFDNFLVKNDDGLSRLLVNLANELDVEGKTKDECVQEYSGKYLDPKTIEACIKEALFNIYKKYQKAFLRLKTLIDKIPSYENGNPHLDNVFLNERIQFMLKAKTLDEMIEGFNYYLTTKEVQGVDKSGEEVIIKKMSSDKYDVKPEITTIKDKIEKTYKYYTYEDALKVDLPNNLKYMPFLIGIAYDLKIEIDKFMKDHGAYRFSDISNLALKALSYVDENGELRVLNEIKSSFKMIMIDEYQDNSDEDDAFFTAISENNLFLVGDVKQSIYGFKGANPAKFNEKYVQYSKENEIKHPENPDPYTMNINYRSRKEILDGVNDIFGNFMDEQYGGVNYKDNHALLYGGNYLFDKSPLTNDKDKGIKKMMVGDSEQLLAKFNSLVDEKDRITEDDLKKNEFYLTAALSIIDRINNHAKVAKVVGKDKDGNAIYDLVDATYKDFAVLARNNVKGDGCRKIFSALGLPVNIVADEVITQDVLVVTLISFLNLINLMNNDEGENKLINGEYVYVHKNEVQFKHYFASILRSFVIDAGDQVIYDQLAEKNNKEITNFKFRENPIYIELEQFADEHKTSSLSKLVIDIVNKYNFIEKLAKVGNAIASMQKLTKLLEKISAMDEIGYTLSDLAYFFENMNKLDLKFEARLGNDSTNAITIETFHKSKGLEFPIIYIDCTDELVGSTDRTNNLSKGSTNTSFYGNPNIGCFVPSKVGDKGIPKTFLVSLYQKMLEDKCSVSEETRLFYVALTRAKEVAVCVFPTRDEPLDHSNKDDVNSYADIVEFSGFKISDDEYEMTDKPLQVASGSSITLPTVSLLDNQISYEPIGEKAHRPSIQSSSEVNEQLLKLGIRYHAYMQYVNFDTKDTSFIKNEEHRKNVDKVLSLDVFKDLSNARLYREYKYYDQDIDENGIIDLLIVYPDRCVVVDYKLKNADVNKYASQLEAYKNYVEKVFKKPTNTVLISLLGN